MQNNDLTEKKILKFDGEEVPGLVFVGELVVEKGTLEVPEFRLTRVISNGITKIPIVEVRYKIKRGTETAQFFKDYFYKDEIKDITIIRTDAHGSEFARTLLQECECIKYSEPEADSASPIYAQISMTILPWDLVPIAAE